MSLSLAAINFSVKFTARLGAQVSTLGMKIVFPFAAIHFDL